MPITTTATAASATTSLLVVSAAGIQKWQGISGAGIPANTVITQVEGLFLTISNATTAPLNATLVTIGAPFGLPEIYYDSLVTSAYQLVAPNMLAWLNANLKLFQDQLACLVQFLTAFQLSTAIGAQLDVLGLIIGQSRTVAFQPGGSGIQTFTIAAGGASYVVGNIVTVVQGGAAGGQLLVTEVSPGGGVTAASIILDDQGNGYAVGINLPTTGGAGTGFKINITSVGIDPTLDDTAYRTLLQCRVFQNHWNGQIDSMQAFWQQTFPGGSISIRDNQNMTATVNISGSFSSIMLDLIAAGYVVPRPQAVAYTFITPILPVFGFDLNTTFLGGFDGPKFGS